MRLGDYLGLLLLQLAARSEAACPADSVNHGLVYGVPDLGCCAASPRERLLCDLGREAAEEDRALAGARCAEAARGSAAWGLRSFGASWQGCEALCDADPECQLWTLQPAVRGAEGPWRPAVCRLAPEPPACAPAQCPLRGALSGRKDCGAVSVRRLAAGTVLIRVVSAGYSDGNTAAFYLDNQELAVSTSTGMNVATLGADGSLDTFRTFDTHGPSGSGPLATFLNGLSAGTVVLMAARDEAQAFLSQDDRAAIALCGATRINSLGYRASYSLIGVKGGAKLAEVVRPEGGGMADTSFLYRLAPAPVGYVGPVNIKVVSEGYNALTGGAAEFFVDNQRLLVPHGRGLNVVVLTVNGTFNSSRIFDTHSSSGSGALVDFLEDLPPATPVLVAAQDDAKTGLTTAAEDALRGCGATLIGDLRYRSGYALAGVKGGWKLAEAVVAADQGPVEVLTQYELGATTTTLAPTSTTTPPPPPCVDFRCPTGHVLKLGAGSLQGDDVAACCDAAAENVVGLLVKSAGWADANIAEFYLGGSRLSFGAGRGMNVVVLQPDGSAVRSGERRPQTFDTNQPGPASNLTAFLDGLENGTVVLIAAKDEAWEKLTTEAEAAVARCGGARIGDLRRRSAYALIGVKGGPALAEVVLDTGLGTAVAIAHLTVDPNAARSMAKPVCAARASNPPVKGWVANRQLELEAGCRYELWEGPNAGRCLDGSWMVVVGGSNTVLMALQLANMLAPEAIMPVRDGATMGGFTVVDVIVRGGSVVYSNSQKLANCTVLPYDSLCKAGIAALVAAAPAYTAGTGGTRITLFEARFWDHADVALETLVADTRWAGAPMGMLVQVSTWYIYCAAMKLSWCKRDDLTRPDLTHPQALALFKSDMAPVVSKLETLCVQGGRAEKHGCWVATTSWQKPAPSQLQWYNDYNGAILSALDGKTSEVLRIVDLWTLGQAFPEQNILGHGSPMLNLWNWQVMLGGMCRSEDVAEGTFAEFDGALCFGADAKRVKISTNPDKWDLAPTTGAKCSDYWSHCRIKGGSHLRCEPWECANSVPCKLTAVVRDRVEANLSGACYDNITCDFAAKAFAGEAPCSRVWCDAGLQFVPALAALLLVAALFSSSFLWGRYAPERLKQKLGGGGAADAKKTAAGGPKGEAPASKPKESTDAKEAAAEKPAAAAKDGGEPAEAAAPALLIDVRGQEDAAAKAAPKSPTAVAVAVKEEEAPARAPAGGAKPPQDEKPPADAKVAEATKAVAATGKDAAAVKKPKGAGDKFPLGLARMCASMHVVVGHLYAKGGVIPNFYFFGWGFTWVPWFFMLSGFVLFTAHLRRPKDEGVFEYVLRRSVTIYPLYAVSLIPAFAIAKVLDNGPSALVLVAQSWLLQAWVPFWTESALQMHCWFLSAMVVYWFLFKPLSRCLKDLSLRATVCLMASLFFLPWLVVIIPAIARQEVTWYKEHSGTSTATWLDIGVVFLKFHPACYLHVFVLGMLLAKLRLLLDVKAVAAGMPRRWRLPLEFVAPAGYAGLFLIFFWETLRPWGYKLSTRLSVLLPFQAAVLFGLAGLPSLPQGRLAAFASKFDFLENYSYAVYVFQFICYSVWPKQKDINLIFFLIFLVMTAVFMVHMVQRPVQKWWAKHPRARWAIPITLSVLLGGLELLLPRNRGVELPAFIRHDSRMIDVRLAITDDRSNGGSLMNPSLLVKDGQVLVAARRHRLETSQRSDDGSCSEHGASGCTIVDQTWYSEILQGSAPFDAAAWARWPTSGEAPFEATLSPWSALRTPAGQPWAHLCVREEYVPRNNTLIRHVVTGPEDPKLVSLSSGSTAVLFTSLPPLGADGCSASRGLAPVAQMYMAERSDDPARAVGRRIDYGSQTEPEKNWIPFTANESGRLLFTYKPVPHETIACEDSGNLTCESRFAEPFQALQRFQLDHAGLEWRGSAQAVLIEDAEKRTPNLPRRHYLGLMHAVELATKRYVHFAYRFTAEAPYAILQVSQQLPLQGAPADSNSAAFAFASGLSVVGDVVAVSYGAGDRDARALVMTMDRLDEFFACSTAQAPAAAAVNGTARR